MAIDSIIPQNLDMISSCIRSEGSFPKTHFIARFNYQDGSIREFDGESWKLVQASYKATLSAVTF